MKRTVLQTLAALAMIGLALSCARIGAPPGGLEDKTGPKVVESYPKADSTNVPRKLVARLVFSKPVNHPSVESALYMSPDPRQRLRYRWRGNTLELIYLDTLLENRTYVISVGSQAKDLRGNPAGVTSTVAFSTGSRIDRGSIDGWISDVAAPQAVSVWAYQLREDTIPNPVSDEADYRLQVGSDAKFQFAYLRAGRYRLYAVTDRNFDGLWNPPSELLGIPPWDVTVHDSTEPWISFRLSMQDSAAPKVRASREITESEVDLRTSPAVPNLQAVFSNAAGDSLRELDAFPDTAGSEIWRVFPQKPLSAGVWKLGVSGTDHFGRPWSGTDTVNVAGRPDTARLRIAESDPASRAVLRLAPEFVRLIFSRPVRMDSLSAADFRVASSDTDSVAVRPVPRGPHTLDLLPAKPLSAGKRYTLQVNGKVIRDSYDRTLSDTTIRMQFTVLSPDSLGGIKGELTGKTPAQYIYRVLELKKHEEASAVVAPGPGPFTVDLVPVGKYIVEVLRDVNRDSLYSYGRMWPFQFSEPFLISPDTVSIRARWEYETKINWQDNP